MIYLGSFCNRPLDGGGPNSALTPLVLSKRKTASIGGLKPDLIKNSHLFYDEDFSTLNKNL